MSDEPRTRHDETPAVRHLQRRHPAVGANHVVVVDARVRVRIRSAVKREMCVVLEINARRAGHVRIHPESEGRVVPVLFGGIREIDLAVANFAAVAESPRVVAARLGRDGLRGAAEVEDAGNHVRAQHRRERIDHAVRVLQRELRAARDRDRHVGETRRLDIDGMAAEPCSDASETKSVRAIVDGVAANAEYDVVEGHDRVAYVPVRPG